MGVKVFGFHTHRVLNLSIGLDFSALMIFMIKYNRRCIDEHKNIGYTCYMQRAQILYKAMGKKTTDHGKNYYSMAQKISVIPNCWPSLFIMGAGKKRQLTWLRDIKNW